MQPQQQVTYQNDIDNQNQFEMHHQNVSMEQLPVHNEFMIADQFSKA